MIMGIQWPKIRVVFVILSIEAVVKQSLFLPFIHSAWHGSNDLQFTTPRIIGHWQRLFLFHAILYLLRNLTLKIFVLSYTIKKAVPFLEICTDQKITLTQPQKKKATTSFQRPWRFQNYISIAPSDSEYKHQATQIWVPFLKNKNEKDRHHNIQSIHIKKKPLLLPRGHRRHQSCASRRPAVFHTSSHISTTISGPHIFP